MHSLAQCGRNRDGACLIVSVALCLAQQTTRIDEQRICTVTVEAYKTSPVLHVEGCRPVTPDDLKPTPGEPDQPTVVALSQQQVKVDVQLNQQVERSQVQAVKHVNDIIKSVYYFTGQIFGKVYKVSLLFV